MQKSFDIAAFSPNKGGGTWPGGGGGELFRPPEKCINSLFPFYGKVDTTASGGRGEEGERKHAKRWAAARKRGYFFNSAQQNRRRRSKGNRLRCQGTRNVARERRELCSAHFN